MEKTGYAFFVKHPRIMEDLLVLHPVDMEKRYCVMKEISLNPIDYENFQTDMTVDRSFIEQYAQLCEDGPIKKCLFVHGRNPQAGILVMPENSRWVGSAAYLCKKTAE